MDRFCGTFNPSWRQIRFVELVIDQLTVRRAIEAVALYDPPFTSIHSGGPDALFADKENVIEGILYEALEADKSGVTSSTG